MQPATGFARVSRLHMSALTLSNSWFKSMCECKNKNNFTLQSHEQIELCTQGWFRHTFTTGEDFIFPNCGSDCCCAPLGQQGRHNKTVQLEA